MIDPNKRYHFLTTPTKPRWMPIDVATLKFDNICRGTTFKERQTVKSGVCERVHVGFEAHRVAFGITGGDQSVCVVVSADHEVFTCLIQASIKSAWVAGSRSLVSDQLMAKTYVRTKGPSVFLAQPEGLVMGLPLIQRTNGLTVTDPDKLSNHSW